MTLNQYGRGDYDASTGLYDWYETEPDFTEYETGTPFDNPKTLWERITFPALGEAWTAGAAHGFKHGRGTK